MVGKVNHLYSIFTGPAKISNIAHPSFIKQNTVIPVRNFLEKCPFVILSRRRNISPRGEWLFAWTECEPCLSSKHLILRPVLARPWRKHCWRTTRHWHSGSRLRLRAWGRGVRLTWESNCDEVDGVGKWFSQGCRKRAETYVFWGIFFFIGVWPFFESIFSASLERHDPSIRHILGRPPRGMP